MRRFAKGFLLALVGGLVLALLLANSLVAMLTVLMKGPGQRGYSEDESHLVVLRIEGPILQPGGLLDYLESVSENSHCKGLLVRVDSPGGAVGASQEIYGAIKRIREGGLPVVVSMGNTAASGGYYVALGGQRIFANPGTATGSIGVVAQFPQAHVLMDKWGVSVETIKSGRFKDAGSPFRGVTSKDRDYLQAIIQDTFEQFLSDILDNRPGLTRAGLGPIADGRILTGRQALEAGLIDTLGGLHEARNYLWDLAGFIKKPKIIELPRREGWVESLGRTAARGASALVGSVQPGRRGGLLYWMPLGEPGR